MSILSFIGRFILSAGLACIMSISFSMGITALLFSLAHAFEWNYRGDTYWIFNVSFITLVISWIISFGCFMSITK
jgi:hypothetical protein